LLLPASPASVAFRDAHATSAVNVVHVLLTSLLLLVSLLWSASLLLLAVADISPIDNVPAVSGDPDVAVIPAFAEVLIKQTIRLSNYDYRADIFYTIGLSIIVALTYRI
jgi:hypothetical protein